MFRTVHHVAAQAGGRPSARRRIASPALALFSLASQPTSAIAQGEPSVTVKENGGIYDVAAAFSVPEAPAVALATLTDYARIPRFMPEVRTSNVIERADDRAVVELEAVARFMMFSKRVHLVLEVQQEQGTIRFRDRSGKSFSRYQGVWTVTEHNGITQVRYELSAKPSFEVPEFLLKRLLKRDATQMIERLKAEIRARARQPAN